MITLRGSPLEVVESFSYLRSEVGKNAKVDGDVGIRLEKASRVHQKWRKFSRVEVSAKRPRYMFSEKW